VVRADGGVTHVTDTQLIELSSGSLGAIGNYLIPPQPIVVNQGGHSSATFGTGVSQPLTQLLKVSAANGMARADVEASVERARSMENSTALTVHLVYYKILIGETRRRALQARVQASVDLQNERTQQVKYGSALDGDLIESRAQWLQAKQELLATDLQLSDQYMQFNDVIGLPLVTRVQLDPNVEAVESERHELEECLGLAVQSHPEIAAARAEVEKAASAVRLARYDFVPDVDVFARYSHTNNVPFLASNFGMLGIRLSYELFSGGRKRATLRERDVELAEARENLTRISDDVELQVQTAFNKLERTRQMMAVSDELVSLRSESRRMTVEQVSHGSALRSQSLATVALELEARAGSLQSQLDYLQAAAELDEAIGRTPR
jgi:outer membrane protein TolC